MLILAKLTHYHYIALYHEVRTLRYTVAIKRFLAKYRKLCSYDINKRVHLQSLQNILTNTTADCFSQ